MKTQLEILIKTVADTTGIKLTTDQAQKLNTELQKTPGAADRATESTAKTGKAAGDSAKRMTEFAKAGTDTNTMLAGLERASRGGIDAIFGIANAFRGFIGLVRTAVVASGPLGILVTALGLAAGAMLALTGRTKETAQSLEEAKRQAQELAKLRLDQLNEQLRLAGTNAEEARAKLDAAAAAAERLDNAEQAAVLAEIRADTSLSPEEKARRESAVRRDFAERADGRQRARLDADVQLAEAEAARVRQATITPEATYRESLRRRQELEQQQADRRRAEELRSESARAVQQGDLARARELDQEISAIAQRTADFTPEALKKAQEIEAEDLQVANKARAALAAEEAKVAKARNTREAESGFLDTVAGFRNRQFAADETVAVRAAQQPAGPRSRPSPGITGNDLFLRQQAREEQRRPVLDEIGALEDQLFRIPNRNSPEARRLTEEISSKRSALAESDAKFDDEMRGLAEKAQQITQAFDGVVNSIKGVGEKLAAAADAAASRVGSGGSISRGGQTIEVKPGDEKAVASALGEAKTAQQAANAETVETVKEMKADSEKTARQMANMRERSDA